MENLFNQLDISMIPKEANPEIASLLEYSSENLKFFCKKCRTTPDLEFEDLTNLTITCGCEEDIDFNLEQLNSYIVDISVNTELKKFFFCEAHDDIFKFYCRKCNSHKCKDCPLCEITEELIDFSYDEFNMKEKILFIAKCLCEDNKNIDFKLFQDDNNPEKTFKDEYLRILISTLIREYFETPNITIIKNINKFYQILLPFKDQNTEKDVDINIFIEIKSLYEYIENKKNTINIKKITLAETNIDINILRNETFINLEELNLEQNIIKDISALNTIKCQNLKILNLKINVIDDDMIDYIGHLDFPNLEDLNLSNNYFKNFKIFKSIEHFNKLKKFKINSNLLTIFSENDTYNLESIEEINLSNGIFSEIDINKLFKKFKFKNLISLDLSKNNLASLYFLKDLEFSSLEELFLSNNLIKDDDLVYLYKFPCLKKINIQKNLIKNIDSVNKLINEKSLDIKDVIISGNPINLYSVNYVNIEDDNLIHFKVNNGLY